MKFLLLGLTLSLSFLTAAGQSSQKTTPPLNREPQLTRTTTRHEVRRFAYGGTLTVIGPPEGSITIEGWSKNEVDISAEIQLRADSEKDLDLLAAVNTFVLDEDVNHLRVLSTGTHDKAFMKSVAKKFPKTLLGLPWRIDYRIRVPLAIDLEVNAGRGPVTITDVEGNILLSAAEGSIRVRMSSGTLSGTVAIGNVVLDIPVRSWRGVGADFRVANGDITVNIPPGFSGDFDAEILGSGKIQNSFAGLAPRESNGLTSQKVKLRAGAGGAAFSFTVVNGVISITKRSE
jgi:hypothetical protein